jgi:hypothetical protein
MPVRIVPHEIFFDRILMYVGGQVSKFRTVSKDEVEALDAEIRFVMNNSGYSKDKKVECIYIRQDQI